MRNFFGAWLPPVLWAGMIFSLSNTPDLNSGLDCDFLLRKAAHVTEYLILTLLLQRALRRTSRLDIQWRLIWSALGAFLYAVSDEFHQTFIRGRQGAPTDVLIDSIGIGLAVLGILLMLRRQRTV